MTYSINWDLDVFFKGGSSSEEFAAFLVELSRDVLKLDVLVRSWKVQSAAEKDQHMLESILELYEQTKTKLEQAGAFVSCLGAQDVQDKKAEELGAQYTKISADLQNALILFNQKLVTLDEEFFQDVLKTEGLRELKYIVNEYREKAKDMLSVEEESLINELAVDGYHGWSQLYDTIVSSIVIPFEEDGEFKQLSVGQAANKFSDPNADVRKRVFAAWEKAWEEKSPLFAKALNHLAGFRLNVYEKRGWKDVLKEPLDINRMDKGTLETMWSVIADNKAPLVRFLNRKAELLGVEKLSWSDLDAPISTSNGATVMSYQEGADFILKHFGKFGSQLASFTKKAFEDNWIEAENRPNKRPGGFCTGFPMNNQSRIFMTYSGTPSNVSTLAHELGHAFHSYALRGTPPLNRDYAMNVAETASTFAELIVADASVKEAQSESERLSLLEDKIQRSVALLMNIHARFLFETSFYEERKQGLVPASRLNDLMLQAQKEAYGDALSEYHPTFWASKLHFYITDVPFYNFPYTFGYLFSLGIYAKASQEGEGFEEKYIALLKDTGSMKVEDLARKHLQVELTGREFWEEAVGTCLKDIEEFFAITDSLVQEA